MRAQGLEFLACAIYPEIVIAPQCPCIGLLSYVSESLHVLTYLIAHLVVLNCINLLH
jgi:hypothetical protein